MLTNRPRFPLAVMSSAMSPQISPERMPVSSPNESALCSTLSLALSNTLTCASRQHAMGMHLWPVFDLEGFPGVGSQLPLTNTPVKELRHLLEDTGLGLGCQGDALVRLERLQGQTRPASFPSLYLRTLGESWVIYPSTSFPWLRERSPTACFPKWEVSSDSAKRTDL